MSKGPTTPDRSIRNYLLLVFGLSLPFWLVGAFADRFLPPSMPISLPPSALMAFVPMIAALILTAKQHGASGFRVLLARAVDGARVRAPGWWLAAILLMPVAMLLAWGLVQLRDGPISHPVLPLARLPVFFLMFLTAGLGEELGWQGFLYERLTPGLNALDAALLIGAIWVVWHIIPMTQTGHDAVWSAWQLAAMIPLRIITVWLFAAGGRSLLLVAVFHAMTNVSEFMFPNYGSHYDPMITCLILAVVATLAVLFWGPRTLDRFRLRRA